MSLLVHDRDRKFSMSFGEVFTSTGAKVKMTSRQAPNMNPYAESWIATAKRECLDRFIMLGEGHFRHILETYVAYYNSVRCHSSLGNEPLNQADPPKPEKVIRDNSVECHTWLGGVLRHYQRPAA